MSYAPKPVDLKAGEEFHWLHNPAIAFTPQTDETRFICTCGATKNAPFCDGAHAPLNAIIARGGEQSLPTPGVTAPEEFDNGSR
jgi:CDGSH-type Zn-finger protein